MRLVVQRVLEARVSVDNACVGKIDHGLMILVGITHDDTESQVKFLAQKVANLRIFSDLDDKMNLSVLDVAGSVLAVSQFTLYADIVKGNRPSYVAAARPNVAQPLYKLFINELSLLGVTVASGIFGADMQVSLINDGPVTIIMDK